MAYWKFSLHFVAEREGEVNVGKMMPLCELIEVEEDARELDVWSVV